MSASGRRRRQSPRKMLLLVEAVVLLSAQHHMHFHCGSPGGWLGLKNASAASAPRGGRRNPRRKAETCSMKHVPCECVGWCGFKTVEAPEAPLPPPGPAMPVPAKAASPAGSARPPGMPPMMPHAPGRVRGTVAAALGATVGATAVGLGGPRELRRRPTLAPSLGLRPPSPGRRANLGESDGPRLCPGRRHRRRRRGVPARSLRSRSH